MVVDSAVPRVVHFCASLELPRRWSLCLEGLYVNGVLHLSSGFALLGFPRSCTRLLSIVVFPSSSESGDQCEYGYDRPRSCSRCVLPWSGFVRFGLRGALPPKLHDTRSRSCPHCVLAVCLVVSGDLAHPAPRPVAAREYTHREALRKVLCSPSCSSRAAPVALITKSSRLTILCTLSP